jgi:hypothetical protein
VTDPTLALVDSSCSLVSGVPRFSLVFGRSWTEVGLKCFLSPARARVPARGPSNSSPAAAVVVRIASGIFGHYAHGLDDERFIGMTRWADDVNSPRLQLNREYRVVRN